MLVETVVLLITLLVLLSLYVHQKWQVLKKYGIPHTPPKILRFGHLMDFMQDGFLQLVRDKNPLGSVCGYYLGIAPRIRISDPEILKQIMIKEFHTFPVRQTNSYLNGEALNNGLVSVEGD